MPTFWAVFPAMHGNTLVLQISFTPSGPSLGGPYTGSTLEGTLLGSPGENAAKLGTILPLPYQSLY